MKQRIPAFDEFLFERSFPTTDISFVKQTLNDNKDKLIAKNLGSLDIINVLNSIFLKYSIKFHLDSGKSVFDDMSEVALIRGGIDDEGVVHVDCHDYLYEIFEDDYLFDSFISVLSRVIIHERTHLHQLNQLRKGRELSDYYDILAKLKTNVNNRFKYLSSKQEIMAFAVEAVEEFRSLKYSDEQILKKMKTPFVDNVEGNIFYLYTDYFDYRGDYYSSAEKKKMKAVIDKFLMYMYQYITKDSIKL